MEKNGNAASRGAMVTWTRFVLACVLLLSATLYALLDYSWRTVDPASIAKQEGHTYVISISLPADTDAEARRSTVQIRENGRRLGPSHSQHQRIQNTGKGAFSAWYNVLYFSTSDNTDPRHNGRTYEIGACRYDVYGYKAALPYLVTAWFFFVAALVGKGAVVLLEKSESTTQ